MKAETRKKVASCKALQEMTVADLCATVRFRDNLAAYMTAQRTDRDAIRKSYDAMRKLGGAKGYKLPAHPIDRVIGLTVEQFAQQHPTGRYLVKVASHLTAVIDGVIKDAWNTSNEVVYKYFEVC